MSIYLAPLGCGEHGGDPDSVKFCHKPGLNYVSCSPYRVPVARLAATGNRGGFFCCLAIEISGCGNYAARRVARPA